MAESTKTRREHLNDLRERITAKEREGQEIISRVEGEGRNFSGEEMKTLKEINEAIKGLTGEQTSLMEAEQLTTEFSSGMARRAQVTLPAPFAAQPESQGDRAALGMKSLGESFLDSPQIKQWYGEVSHDGYIPENAQLKSPRFNTGSMLKGFMRDAAPNNDAMKALVTGLSATSAGALFQNQFLGLPDPSGVYQRPLTLMDLVRRVPVTSDVVEYARIGTPTNAAAPVAEATATSGSTGEKPESSFPLAVVTETIRNIAHWIPVTRRALADAPMIRQLIDGFLRYGLMEEMEDQMISGAGTGENFTGILNVSGTQSQAFVTDLLTTTRKARTIAFTAYVFNPNDWEDIELLTDNEERFYMGGPRGVLQPMLWGVPVVENQGMTEGTAVLGDWRWAWLFDREQTAVYVSDSHSDFFIRNLLAVLAEARAAFGCPRPSAFVEIALA
jgi:HK97 family phage major capsid protein